GGGPGAREARERDGEWQATGPAAELQDGPADLAGEAQIEGRIVPSRGVRRIVPARVDGLVLRGICHGPGYPVGAGAFNRRVRGPRPRGRPSPRPAPGVRPRLAFFSAGARPAPAPPRPR